LFCATQQINLTNLPQLDFKHYFVAPVRITSDRNNFQYVENKKLFVKLEYEKRTLSVQLLDNCLIVRRKIKGHF